MSQATLSQQFASALCSLDRENIPDAVIHAAKRALLDTLGAGLAGSSTPEVQYVLRAVSSWQEQGTVRTWGHSCLLSPPHAALVNGTAAHAREVDDFNGCGHSGAVVVPAALATADKVDASGIELLIAIVRGYEAANRVIELVGGNTIHNNVAGWHGTGTCGIFGAAAATACLLRLDSAQAAHALGIAGSYTGGIWSFIANGAMSKRLHAGKASEGGLVAAYLAREGMTGPSHVFESDWGSFTTLYGGEHAAPEELLRDIGNEFYIFHSGFKPFACCRGCHSPVEAALALRTTHHLIASQIYRVVIHACDQTARRLGKQHVENVLDAQMSIPYSVAVALCTGTADLEHFLPPYLHDRGILDLARRVAVVDEPSRPIGSQPTVELFLCDGRSLSMTVPEAKGETRNPLSDEELNAKFIPLATLGVTEERAARLSDMIWNLDQQTSTRELLQLLSSETESSAR